MDPPQTDRSDKNRSSNENHSSPDYAPYPNLDPKEGTFVKGTLPSEPSATAAMASSPPQDSVVRNPQFPTESAHATTFPRESNPYISPSSAPPKKDPMVTVRDVLSKWGKRVGEAVKEAEDLAGNVWQHLKTGPSVADAAMGRIAQGTKVLAEGGYEKIFQQTFDTLPEEELRKSYACYLSTSAGPIMGILYLSTAKLAFCSDNPLPYKAGDQTEWSYYKVVIPLHQLKAVNPSVNNTNPAEKYIQIISVDNHEFWFMGFVTYDNAVTHLREALGQRVMQVV